jgi:hypothetical protein
MQRATEPKPRAFLPGATWAAIGLMVLAVLLSVSLIVFLSWHGIEQPLEADLRPLFLVLLAVIGCAFAGAMISGVGVERARRVGARVSAISLIVSVLSVVLLIASLCQLVSYMFIGG